MPNRHIHQFFTYRFFKQFFCLKDIFVKFRSFVNNRDLKVTFDGFEYIKKY